MNKLLLIIVVMVVWFLLQAVILPKFGVKTWLVQTRQGAGEKIKAAEEKPSAPEIK
jgi:hypothetical protein